jgi:hypothetical protein
MKDAAAIRELDRWVRAQPQMQLQVLSEKKYYEERRVRSRARSRASRRSSR